MTLGCEKKSHTHWNPPQRRRKVKRYGGEAILILMNCSLMLLFSFIYLQNLGGGIAPWPPWIWRPCTLEQRRLCYGPVATINQQALEISIFWSEKLVADQNLSLRLGIQSQSNTLNSDQNSKVNSVFICLHFNRYILQPCKHSHPVSLDPDI